MLDAAICVIVVADIVRYTRGGWSLLAASKHMRVEWQSALQALNLTISLVIGLPLFFTATRLLFSRYSRRHGKLAREVSARLGSLHIVVSLLLALFALLLEPMVVLSGLSLDSGRYRFAFFPWFSLLAALGGSYAALVIQALVVILGSTLLVFVTRKADLSDFAREAYSRLCLLDLRSELYPVGYSPRRANFVSGAISPGIEYVHQRGGKLIRDYNLRSPGSPDASEYLAGVAMQCRDLIKERFLRGQDSTSLFVSFTTSTARALEIILSQARSSRLVLLSPFEHETERRVLAWLERQGRAKEIPCSYESRLVERPPHQVADDIAVGLAQHLERVTDERERAVLVLSEVCWATGVRLPIGQILGSLRDLLGWLPFVIVDGAHAIGNGSDELPRMDVIDAYIFGGHKWLFSSAPIGVIVGKTPADSPFPVDLWREGADGQMVFSTATSGPHALSYFAASLEMLGRFDREAMTERSQELRKRLRTATAGRFQFLGIESEEDLKRHSFIVALAPVDGAFWARPSAERVQRHFEERGVHVNVIRAHPRLQPAIRVTLPYFQNLRDLDMLIGALNALR